MVFNTVHSWSKDYAIKGWHINSCSWDERLTNSDWWKHAVTNGLRNGLGEVSVYCQHSHHTCQWYLIMRERSEKNCAVQHSNIHFSWGTNWIFKCSYIFLFTKNNHTRRIVCHWVLLKFSDQNIWDLIKHNTQSFQIIVHCSILTVI